MPTLEFKGKEVVYAHHLGVPFRPLVPVAAKSVLPSAPGGTGGTGGADRKSGKSGKGGKVGTDGALAVPEDSNLVVHGDNLHALKALMPRYAGRVNCVCIDPPYNTGGEGWAYNDNVNSPQMKRWLRKTVDREDLERHDKWLCMMWPRLKLLRELMSESGFIFVFIDDNEQHRLRMMMDEVFGQDNQVAQFIVQTNPRGRSLHRDVAQTHEHVMAYAKDSEQGRILEIPKSDKALAEYDCEDEGGRFRLLRLRNSGIQFFNRKTRPNLFFPIYVNPSNGKVSLAKDKFFRVKVLPLDPKGAEGCWTWGTDKIKREGHLLVGGKTRAGEWRVYRKDYLPANGDATTKVRSLWVDKDINHEVGKEMFTEILPDESFPHPKSPWLTAKLIRLACGGDGIVLDSFAGSGTTAHAVLALNAEDGGSRRFILAECEDYADNITAERVRRIIRGVPEAKDENLRKGFGGDFVYCELGDAVEPGGLLTGKLPDYAALADYLAHTATGTHPATIRKGRDWFFAESERHRMHLIYKPDAEFLRSDKSALSDELAERIGAAARNKGKTALVFASHKFMSHAGLAKLGAEFSQLPYALQHLNKENGDEL